MLPRNKFSAIRNVVLALLLCWPNLVTLSGDRRVEGEFVSELLGASSDVDALFVLVLPEVVDQRGEFGLEIPLLAESLLPSMVEAQAAVETRWLSDGKTESVPAMWHRAGRGSASRLSVARSDGASRIPTGAILIMGRVVSEEDGTAPEFYCRVVAPDEDRERLILCNYFGIASSDVKPGVFAIYSPWSVRGPPFRSEALQKFLRPFDRIVDRGFVPTQRSGSTGVGYTLESLLKIQENNRPLGDFRGMEVKAHRANDLAVSGSKRMNLFLKEPTWIDGLSHRERIPKYGYVDDNGRVALYSTVTSRENSHGLKLSVNDAEQRVNLLFQKKSVAFWAFDVLQSRLSEKLTETAFVGAMSRGKGKAEEFHYKAVLFCQGPTVQSLTGLIESRESMVEMRMHIREDGSARNHGTAFRIHQDQLPRLYTRTVQIRVR